MIFTGNTSGIILSDIKFNVSSNDAMSNSLCILMFIFDLSPNKIIFFAYQQQKRC